MKRIQVGDQVVVMRGEHKSKRGKVSRVLYERNMLIVEGVNLVKRHVQATQQRPGGILEVEAPLHVSKVMLLDPQTNRPTRVHYSEKDGKKQRLAKSDAALPEAQK